MKRRVIALAAAILVALVAVGGAALAQTLSGDDRDNRLTGSSRRDQIARRGARTLYGCAQARRRPERW